MTQEEKAKRYEEALERAKKAIKYPDKPCFARVDEIFPELKESEDEKIRKRMIDFFTDWHRTKSHCFGISVPRILAWLEKQGEQILANSAKTCKNEQKPTWSEEDEEHVNSLLQRLEGLCRKEFATTRFAINEDEDWLKSLKERVQPQSKSALEINNEVLLHVPAIEDTNKVLRDMICEYFGDGRPMDEDEINAFKKWLLSKVKKQ